ncbi:3-(3-hydroxy-phenyl)propionate hydroxylase/6-hydroxy-3-succinoylpyridine 3-monooxygenase [Actinomadura algeriensis]|uniref:3-(3-hydroxy-phenyl)propionate hydroxylase/6-hydroxy-3-succinoylpyridine 3-monooxygenase n=1 Tax=Actinomadura algeriensis TaxID=1679523 RepID=A0ABR9K2C2_9ACTN|nr:3-(3-hydroxy-phenyl)propionate hydroxylase/6-hydroxy-3-succinoylpyridine 3-monooxygenase [Actinomadura algeriensis]
MTVLERNEDVVRAPRAVVYHWATLEGLDRLSVLKPAVDAGFLKKDYCFLNWRTGERVRYGLSLLEGTVEHPYNLHLRQDRLVDVVLKTIEREALPVDVRWGRNVIGLQNHEDRVMVTALCPDGSPEQYRAEWVIGADGAGSAVRTLLGMPFEGFTWPERFVATDVVYPFEEEGYDQTTFVVDEQYGAIIVKIDGSSDAGLWRYTYSDPAADSPDGVERRMDEFFSTLMPRADRRTLRAFSPYKMHQRCAPAFRMGRVLLAGDAAHATNPTGGLGLTSGLFDSYLLIDELAAVVHGRADAWVLDRYAHERRRVFNELVSPTASANKKLIFGSTQTAEGSEAWARVQRLGEDEEAARSRLMFPKSLETLVPVAR